MKNNYIKLCNIQKKLYRLSHARSFLNWDRSTMMSSNGNKARSESLAEITSFMHELLSKKNIKKLILNSEEEDLNHIELANLREIKRSWLRKSVLPKKLIIKSQISKSNCEFEWRVQRKNNDWKGFLKNFKEVVKYSQEEAKILSDALNISAYDALMDRYDPGLKTSEVDKLFDQIKKWLPTLISKASQRQNRQKPITLGHSFNRVKQKKLCLDVIKLLGFNFEKGRLDESLHPFCAGVREDIRITTRFNKGTFLNSLFAAIHETGHAQYEQNLPTTLFDQPVSNSRSMSIHESQSLFFEKQIGCNPNFVRRISPLIKKYFGDKPELNHANIFSLVNSVKPSFIRVDADEVTYPAHIILRYEIEKDLINCNVKAEEVPSMWNEKMADYLGLNTSGNYSDGVLQDIHWPGGQFGYFPCYTLGAIYAAQWFYFAKQEIRNIEQVILNGNLTSIFDWLNTNIWSHGSILSTKSLTKKACKGKLLNVKYFKNHLENRYLN
ncbi:MAG: hypothetical protein CBD16_00345 [Betaproteobacteria bacterium TMED156]|nr:MAG: hypothetical protein CBD16_00345 [Betaproteobacteria bacterium TMED156]